MLHFLPLLYRSQYTKLLAWVLRLGSQLRRSLPLSQKPEPTDWKRLAGWAGTLSSTALGMANFQLGMDGQLNFEAAHSLQFAIIANLLVGISAPPLRAGIIRSVAMPISSNWELTCQDEDCLLGDSCQGNRFVYRK